MATVRREVRIDAPPDAAWRLVTDPAAIARWFPGVVDVALGEDADGPVRTVEFATGLRAVERIVTNDPTLRRFQYRIVGMGFRSHLGTVDVIDLGDDTSLVVHGTDASPDVMALIIGGAAGAGLETLRTIAEATVRSDGAPAGTPVEVVV